MKLFKSRLRVLALAAGSLAITVLSANAAADTAYNTNDMLLFFRNPGGSTATDQVVIYSLGSTYDVFRDAATPGDSTFGTTISLGNINTALGTYGTDWTSLAASSTIFAGAVGQNGDTSNLSTSTLNEDYARTIYTTKKRAGAGTLGLKNSTAYTLPAGASSQGTLAGNIDGSNSVALGVGITQPDVLANGDTTIDTHNPITGSTPGTAYGFISGGVMGSLSSTTYSLGGASNVVLGLDLFRATPVLNSEGWQDVNSISGVSARSGYYLGTVTLSSNGDVNFVAVPEPSTYALLALAGVVVFFAIRRRKAQA